MATLREDAVAGLVLGVQSVPDGLATGLLAGVNPLSGLYAYLVGTFTGALVTSSSFMAIQGTGAMAMIVADVPAVHTATDAERALFTLSVLTGLIMLAAGLLRLGWVLRFVSNAVMVGFINAVGVNIVLGQLANFTGYNAEGANRVVRALNTFLNPGELHPQTLVIGIATIGLILLFERTRIGALGLVVAVVITSAGALLLGWQVAMLNDLGVVASTLPRPTAPLLGLVRVLLLPAASLAFVGLVQGASISANFPNPDGTYGDASRDFIGQGAANVAAGVLQGMPVGGSVSASALNKAAGALAAVAPDRGRRDGRRGRHLRHGRRLPRDARPRRPLMLIGFRTVKPADLQSVWRTGTVQKVVLVVTFTLTMTIPLQYAVLVGVGVSVILYVVRQSNKITIMRRELDAEGQVIETAPPATLEADDVVVLQPYGSLFFAAAPVFETLLPAVTDASRNSVVVVRLRGRTDLGTTFMDVLLRYAQSLAAAGSKLVVVSTNERIDEQLGVTGITAVIGPDNVYAGDARVGAAVRRAYDDALAWVAANRDRGGSGPA